MGSIRSPEWVLWGALPMSCSFVWLREYRRFASVMIKQRGTSSVV
jgi:hypothetical protein